MKPIQKEDIIQDIVNIIDCLAHGKASILFAHFIKDRSLAQDHTTNNEVLKARLCNKLNTLSTLTQNELLEELSKAKRNH